MERIRLDKYLADSGLGTRNQVKNIIKKGRVSVNGEVVSAPELKVDRTKDIILADGRPVYSEKFEYYMLNKPGGVVSATKDNVCKTVLECIGKENSDLFPVGRLDKDTEGLLLITNDGKLAHKLLAPKNHIGKTYYADIKGVVTRDDVITFLNGICLEKDFVTLPAKLEILSSDEISSVFVTIREGKFHQVKRMFESIGKKVVYLKRVSMGNLKLDEKLAPGEFRPLTEEEKTGLLSDSLWKSEG